MSETPEPTVEELALAAQSAQFEALHVEWNALNRHTDRTPATDARQAECARELRACGLRITAIERRMRKDDYTHAHVRVGT